MRKKVALYLRHPQNDSKEERTMKIEQKVMDLSLAGIFTAVIFVMAASTISWATFHWDL